MESAYLLESKEARYPRIEKSRQTKRDHKHNVSRSETLLELWRETPIKELDPGRIERDLSARAEAEEWMPATFNRYRALVSAIFSLAIKNSKATVNPVKAKGVDYRTENNMRDRYVTADEEAALMEAARRIAPRLQDKIFVAIHSGLRRSELFQTNDVEGSGLRWEHVNFETKQLVIPRSKHGELRRVPIDSALFQALRRIRGATVGSSYVFPGGPTDADRIFPKVVKAAKLNNVSWHTLRHTYGSRLVIAGADIYSVGEMMGHKSIETTKRYAHLSTKRLADVAELPVPKVKTSTATRTSEKRALRAGSEKIS